MAIQTFTAGQILTAAQITTVAKGTDLPGCKVTRTAALTVGGNVAITFDTENWDTDSMFTASSDFITIKTAGLYLVHVNTNMTGTTSNQTPNLFINNANETLSQDAVGGRINYVTTNYYSVNDTIRYRAFFIGGTYTATGTSMTVQYLGAP